MSVYFTPEMAAEYQADGFFLVRKLFSEGELHQVTDYIIENVINSRQLPVVQPHKTDRFLREWGSQERFLDLVQPLLGPDLALWTVHCFYKPSVTGPRTPWHQDARYWAMKPVVTASVWLALEPVDEENGCMNVIPGSHLEEICQHHQVDDEKDKVSLSLEIDNQKFDESKAISIVLDTGDCSVHHSHLIHGAKANNSGRSRHGLVLRYMPTSSIRTDGDLYLARGRDLSNGVNVYIQD